MMTIQLELVKNSIMIWILVMIKFTFLYDSLLFLNNIILNQQTIGSLMVVSPY